MTHIAIMGGTFNPIHLGHLIMAEHVYNLGLYSKILFIPSGQPPHKVDDELVDKWDRLKMCQLAINGNQHFEISDVEVAREGKTYTIDTIEQFRLEFPNNRYTLIIGKDSLFDLHQWYQPESLFEKLSFVVVNREKDDEISIISRIQWIQERFPSADITYCPMPFIDISSTAIRKLKKDNKSIRYLVSEQVNDFIALKNLYQ